MRFTDRARWMLWLPMAVTLSVVAVATPATALPADPPPNQVIGNAFGPEPSAAGALEAVPPLNAWQITADVKFSESVDSYKYTRTEDATFDHSDLSSNSLSWTTEYSSGIVPSCPERRGYTASGSGSGTGPWINFAGGGLQPGDYGLPAGEYTALEIAVGDTFTITGKNDNCGSTDRYTQEESPLSYVGVPVFLPGSLEDLAKAPVGTVLSLSYAKQHSSDPAISSAILSVDFTASKVKPQCDRTIDSDGGGVGDCQEYEDGTDPNNPYDEQDSDGDGRTDAKEGRTGDGTGTDTDGDGAPDYLDQDSDNDGKPDSTEGDGDEDNDGTPDWRDGEDPDDDEPTVVCESPADCLGPETGDDREAAWGKVDFTARRDRWGAVVRTTITDLKPGDGKCVYAEVRLIVTRGPDPDQRVATVCSDVFITEDRIAAGAGTGIEAVRVKVCREDAFRDTCREVRTPLPQHVSQFPTRVDDAMNIAAMGIDPFLIRKAQGGGGYDWSTELDLGKNSACSVPEEAESLADGYMVAFSPACENHDFGYRNLGKGFILPTDEAKMSVDTTFLRNMKATCDTLSAATKWALKETSRGIGCLRAAVIFYSAVSLGGGKAFYGEG